MRALTLRTRMVLLVVGLLALGLAISTITATAVLRSNLLDELDRKLLTTATTRANESLTESNAFFFSPGVLPSEYFFLVRDSADHTVGVEAQTSTLRRWGQPDLPEMPQRIVEEQSGRPFTVDGVVPVPQVNDGTASEWRVVVYPLLDRWGNYNGSFTVGLPLAGITDTTDQLARILLTVSLVIALGGGVAGFIAVRRTVRPLHTIESTAKAIAAGDLSQRIPAMPLSTEVGSLANSLNVMLGQIETSFDAQARSEARMRQFVSDASHELRTPLVTIRGYSELFRMGGISTRQDIADSMGRIEGAAIQMGGLVENLLALARLDEHAPLHHEPVDLTVLARDALRDLTALDPTRPTHLLMLDSATPNAPDCTVIGDEAKLRQVLTNLVGNAAQHTPTGTPVEIALGASRDAEANRDVVVIEVRDHGPGIPADHRLRVFERFHRVDASRSSASGGSGLGLAIVASIVTAHRGTVTTFETPGGGATFRVEFPGAPDIPSTSGAPGIPSRSGAPAAPPDLPTGPHAPRDAPAEARTDDDAPAN